MSEYIVLVKQVPDVSQITDNAFDPETGTLVRSRLANVVNELDAQALAFARYMKQISGDAKARIVALTMGPPMAEEVLRYSLARAADQVVLLTDRALGGADTWATANPLAYAIRRIVKEILHCGDDYFVVAGMQSVDGDTAQVPGQIAEELQVPCIAYATGAEYKNNRFEFTRIISGGSQTVATRKMPAVITVAKYEYPLFATFAGTRWANKVDVIKWGADDINATHIGAKGSKTAVIRVFPPGKSTRKCQEVKDVKSLAKIIVESFKSSNGQGGKAEEGPGPYVLPARRKSPLERPYEATKKEQDDYDILTGILKEMNITDVKQLSEPVLDKIVEKAGGAFHKKALEDMVNGFRLVEPAFKGEVWVVAEHSGDGVVHPATFELTGKARELADSLETKVGVCIAGDNVAHMAEELIAAGADHIYAIEHKLLKEFDPTAYRKAVSDAIDKYVPQIVLYAATPQGRMLAPMVSYRTGCGLTADCTGLDIRDSSRKGDIGLLLQTRPALGGNVMATIRTKNSKSQMATARPGVMKRIPADPKRKGKVIQHKVELTDEDVSLDIIRTELGSGQVNFAAEAIVSGGKGMQSRDVFDRLLHMLCSELSRKLNTAVEYGASRAAVEQGFVERVHQVGQTGTAVGPKLYVAIGISGAIQHMIGVANTETIVAINSDPNAPIFKQCDYYIVGTAEDVVPELVQALDNV
ncbi:MAG TPA: FAD-binding protein [Sedimentisphaerales bacterium]|nr:FAD-binding protein [Sedimentisphaerales bacterium]HRS12375.1 FAD-binding protein [Sedimentisphaerales bacterium]HRV48915.1 FAD-binding protein [Sedimentisphaerales bacterium]